MNGAEKQKLIGELGNFYKGLQSYQKRQLKRQKTKFSEAQERSLNALRLKLQREHGRLSGVIYKYGGKGYVPILNKNYEVFTYSLNSLDMEFRELDALEAAIGIVNRAIGNLAATTTAEFGEEKSVATAEPLVKVFISHGKESKTLSKIADFLSALGVKPLIIEDEPSLGKDLPDKVNHYLGEADCVVILATGDDEILGKLQPRQNVIHEIGLAQKTHEEKVIYLLEEGVQFPSNIRPKVWEPFNQENIENVLLCIVRELVALEILKAVKP